jgi:hypothetical protein
MPDYISFINRLKQSFTYILIKQKTLGEWNKHLSE